MELMPKPGEFYRHFNNTLYQIVAIAQHTETGEQLVIYQALYGEFGVFAKPLSMFLGEAERVKHPEAKEKYGSLPAAFSGGEKKEGQQEWHQAPSDGINPWLERFLDAEGYDQQLYVLKQMIGKVGQKEVDSIYLVLDISMPSKAGDADSQLRGIIKDLETRKRYDGSRLR